MALQLNSTPEAYKEFYGRNIEQMYFLISGKNAKGEQVDIPRIPMNVSQLMQRRLDTRNIEADVKSSWMDNYFDTGDAVAYHPDGRVKIILDSQNLREMTSESKLSSGVLVLADGAYETLQGIEFTRKELESNVGNSLTREQVKASPIWKVLAKDSGLLADYTDYIFAEGKQRFDFNEMMGVYPASAQNVPTLRAWYVGRLVDRSDADGWGVLVDDYGRLVGIAPEAPSAQGKGATNVRAYTINDIQTAKKQLDALDQFVRPESLDSVKSLLGKL